MQKWSKNVHITWYLFFLRDCPWVDKYRIYLIGAHTTFTRRRAVTRRHAPLLTRRCSRLVASLLRLSLHFPPLVPSLTTKSCTPPAPHCRSIYGGSSIQSPHAETAAYLACEHKWAVFCCPSENTIPAARYSALKQVGAQKFGNTPN